MANSVNVKVQVVGLGFDGPSLTFVSKFESSVSILSILEKFEEKNGVALLSRKPTVQILTKQASENELSRSLAHYGIDKGSCVLRVSFKQDVKNIVANKAEPSKNAEQIPKSVEMPHDGPIEPSFEVFKSSSERKDPEAAKNHDMLTDEDMTIEDARRYQEILKNKANAQSDYVRQKLKKEAEQQKDVKELKKQVLLRIKFPDGSLTQLKFNSNNTIQEMLIFINNSILFKPDFHYNLVIPQFHYTAAHRGKRHAPEKNDNIYHKDIVNNNQDVLSKALLEYSQASFIFELLKQDGKIDTSYKGPFLKQDVPAQAMEKLVADYSNESLASTLENTVKKPQVARKVPKWLKLGKN